MPTKAKLLARLSSMARGRSRNSGTREALAVQPDELREPDDEALLAVLRCFVKTSGLKVSRIAHLMGVSIDTFKRWIDGTTKPRHTKLLEIRTFLRMHAPDLFRLLQ